MEFNTENSSLINFYLLKYKYLDIDFFSLYLRSIDIYLKSIDYLFGTGLLIFNVTIMILIIFTWNTFYQHINFEYVNIKVCSFKYSQIPGNLLEEYISINKKITNCKKEIFLNFLKPNMRDCLNYDLTLRRHKCTAFHFYFTN